MRYPGEKAAGQAPGRRQGQSDKDAPARPGQGAGRGQPGSESSLFSPGYRDGRRTTAEPADDGPRPGSRYGWAGGAASKGPVRGFPPAPGQPPPLYPPGQFSAWNRASGAAGGPADARGQGDQRQAGGRAGPGYSGPGHAGAGYPAAAGPAGAEHGRYAAGGFEPGYSDLAVSDPAADMTSTQTWGAVGDGRETGTWTALRGTGGQTEPDDGWAPPGDGPAAAAPAGPVAADAGRAAADDGRAAADDGRAAADAGQRPMAADAAGQGGGRETQPGGARGRSAGGRSTRAAARRRRRPARWLIAAGLAAIVAAGAVVFFVVGGQHRGSVTAGTAAGSKADPSAGPSPSPSASPAPPGPWRFIATRADDPVPLTLTELFPASYSAGASYARTIRRRGTDCSPAVTGARLQTAVKRGGCSQVLRASYLSAGKKQMGTIGVLNLKTFSAAEKAGKAAGPAQFIAPLDAAKGPTRSLSKAAGLEEAEVKGHYLILVLADFTNLRAPKTKAQRNALESFMSQLIEETVNVSLTSRMVEGKP